MPKLCNNDSSYMFVYVKQRQHIATVDATAGFSTLYKASKSCHSMFLFSFM